MFTKIPKKIVFSQTNYFVVKRVEWNNINDWILYRSKRGRLTFSQQTKAVKALHISPNGRYIRSSMAVINELGDSLNQHFAQNKLTIKFGRLDQYSLTCELKYYSK